MFRHFIKTTALILCIVLLLSAFVSCGGGTQKETESGSDESMTLSGSATDTEAETVDEKTLEIDRYFSGLAGSHDFDGSDFNWITLSNQVEDEFSGDLKNDALYSRNLMLESELNIKINYFPNYLGAELADTIQREVLAGSTSYDVGDGAFSTAGQPLLLNNALMDVSDFEYVDLNRPWWPANMRDTLSINDKLFLLSGLFITSNYFDLSCLLFNKEIAEEYNVEDMYQLVYNGEWSNDKLLEVSEAIPENASGDGVYRYTNFKGISFIFGAGITITKFDDEGTPYLEKEVSIELVDLCDKLSKAFGDEAVSQQLIQKPEDLFINGKSFFYGTTMSGIDQFRKEDIEFGILPIPKADKSQKSYYSWGMSPFAVYVPKIVKNVEMVDVVLESMEALTEKYVTPAVQEIILKGRSTYDNESKDVLDIIFNSRIDDFVLLVAEGNHDWDGPFIDGLNNNILGKKSSDISSVYKVNAKMINRKIDSIVKSLN